MRKLVILTSLLYSFLFFGQVGINTESPKATLDVVAKKTDGSTSEGFIAPRLSGDEIKAANARYTSAQTGALVYATSPISSADTTGKTSNITLPGYYYYDGTVWIDLKSKHTTNTDATRFLGGTAYVKFNTNMDGTLANSKIIGGGAGVPYTLGSYAEVSSAGGINSIFGNGYTISNPSNGIFDIKFDTPMSEIYGLSVNILDAYGAGTTLIDPNPNDPGVQLRTNDNTQVSFISNSILRVKTGNSGGNLSNRSFTFLITGK